MHSVHLLCAGCALVHSALPYARVHSTQRCAGVRLVCTLCTQLPNDARACFAHMCTPIATVCMLAHVGPRVSVCTPRGGARACAWFARCACNFPAVHVRCTCMVPTYVHTDCDGVHACTCWPMHARVHSSQRCAGVRLVCTLCTQLPSDARAWSPHMCTPIATVCMLAHVGMQTTCRLCRLHVDWPVPRGGPCGL